MLPTGSLAEGRTGDETGSEEQELELFDVDSLVTLTPPPPLPVGPTLPRSRLKPTTTTISAMIDTYRQI